MNEKRQELLKNARTMAKYGHYWAVKAVALIEQLEKLEAEHAQMRQVLDDIEGSLRAGDINRALKCGYIWAQRRDDILAGNETWDDQHIGPIYTGDEKH